MIVIVCDRDGCPAHHIDDSPADGWLVAHGMAEDGMEPLHFCGPDCISLHFAGYRVPETVPHD